MKPSIWERISDFTAKYSKGLKTIVGSALVTIGESNPDLTYSIKGLEIPIGAILIRLGYALGSVGMVGKLQTYQQTQGAPTMERLKRTFEVPAVMDTMKKLRGNKTPE